MNNFVVALLFFCAVISLCYGEYSENAGYNSNSDSYFNQRNLGYSHGGAASNHAGYFTNSLDYNPGVTQHQQYQYPVYTQDDLKKPPEYVPIIENGVPKDTPEVQRAKDEHFALFKKLAEAAANAPEDEGREEELERGKNIFQKYQRVQPKINYAPQSNTRQHFTEVYYPKYAPVQAQPQRPQYHQPAPVSEPVRHRPNPPNSAVVHHPQHGIFIVGPDEPKEVQKARADHFAAHKDVLAYIKHTKKNPLRQQPKYVSSGQHQVQSYTPQSYTPQSYTPQSYTPQSYTPQSYTPHIYTGEGPQGYTHESSSSYESHNENIYR